MGLRSPWARAEQAARLSMAAHAEGGRYAVVHVRKCVDERDG